jgi:hypothetical protein
LVGFRLARTAFDRWECEALDEAGACEPTGEWMCWNGERDEGEDGFDCGGLCMPCECVNDMLDGNETDVDCGGFDEDSGCEPCGEGAACLGDLDCQYESRCLDGVCNSCYVVDYVDDVDESDIGDGVDADHSGVFHFCTEEKSWEAARWDCRARGGVLATIEWVNVNSWVYEQVRGLGNPELWIGANDIEVEGSFYWASERNLSSMRISFLPWAPDQPDGGTDGNCLVFDVGGGWSDFHCEEERGYICRVGDL